MIKKIIIPFILCTLFFQAAEYAQLNIVKADKQVLEKIIKERKGKILLLNLWATWCQPCKEEFPDLIAIKKEYSNKNVDVAGLSIDFPDEINSKIIPFLKNTKVNFPVYVTGFKKDEDLINYLDIKWKGTLPATFIFDAGGNEAAFLEGKKNYKEFKTAIDDALKNSVR